MEYLKNEEIEKLFSIHPNFPKPGPDFVHFGPFLANGLARASLIKELAAFYKYDHIDAVVVIDARGFVLASIADFISSTCGVVMARKAQPPKIPGKVLSSAYNYEYAASEIAISAEEIVPGYRYAIVDDVLATGNTALTVARLIQRAGGIMVGVCCLIELPKLDGRKNVLNSSFRLDTLLELTADLKVHRRIPLVLPKHLQPIIPVTANWLLQHKNDPRQVVMCHPGMQLLANKLCARYPQYFVEAPIYWGRFPDRYHHLKFDPQLLRHRHVLFLMSMHDPNTLAEQFAMSMVLPRQKNIKTLTLAPLYWAPGTMERYDSPGTVATAEPFAKMLSHIPPAWGTGNRAQVLIYDIHDKREEWYFTDEVKYTQADDAQGNGTSALPLLWKEMAMVCDCKPWAVVFPDQGAHKKAASTLPEHIPYVFGTKQRGGGDARSITFTESANFPQDPKQQSQLHFVIADDLVQMGGTLFEALKEIKHQYHPTLISAFVTHAVYPLTSYKDFLPGRPKDGFFRVWVTDTHPEMAEKLRRLGDPFRVLSVVDMLAHEQRETYKLKTHPAYMPDAVVVKDVVLASTSHVKTNAVKTVMSSANIKTMLDCDSGVSKQPMGRPEILQGALNRLYAAMEDPVYRLITESGRTPRLFVSIESGITLGSVNREHNTGVTTKGEEEKEAEVVQKTELFDEAVVLIHATWLNQTVQGWTAKTRVPDDTIQDFLNRPNKDTTLGEILVTSKKAKDATDWHKDVIGVSRVFLLQETIRELLNLHFPSVTAYLAD